MSKDQKSDNPGVARGKIFAIGDNQQVVVKTDDNEKRYYLPLRNIDPMYNPTETQDQKTKDQRIKDQQTKDEIDRLRIKWDLQAWKLDEVVYWKPTGRSFKGKSWEDRFEEYVNEQSSDGEMWMGDVFTTLMDAPKPNENEVIKELYRHPAQAAGGHSVFGRLGWP